MANLNSRTHDKYTAYETCSETIDVLKMGIQNTETTPVEYNDVRF